MRKWPEEVVNWLKINVPGRTTKEVAYIINKQGFDQKYGMKFTEEEIKRAKNRYKIKSGTPTGNPKGYSTKYPEGMGDYIKSIAEGRTTKEIAEMVSQRFGIEFTDRQCKTYKKNHGIISGVDCRFRVGHEPANKGKKMSPEQYEKCKGTMFKKGNIPKNKMKLGEYTHTTDGYLVRKIKDKGSQRERFEFVHRAVWEQYHGPVPEGKMVSFLDRNKDNCDIDNLVLIDNDENLELNRSRLRFSESERTKTGLTIAQMKIGMRKKRMKMR